MSNPENKLPLALIAGPTASGKTALALHLAQGQDCTIINADSAQVYDSLPILSAQPSPVEMASAPHKLFGYLDGSTPCSAAAWAHDAKTEIARAHDAGRLPILVGGTGLYLRTLLNGIAPIPDISPDIRDMVRALSTPDAAEKLAELDTQMSAILAPRDSSRIKRALEVILSTGTSIATWRTRLKGGIGDKIHLHPLLLLPPRDWLHERCDQRFVRMMESGAVDEVEALLTRNLPMDTPIMRAIGVPEIKAMLAGEISRDDAILLGQAATRQYAKRQYTWFRNQSPTEWPRYEEIVSYENMVYIETLFHTL